MPVGRAINPANDAISLLGGFRLLSKCAFCNKNLTVDRLPIADCQLMDDLSEVLNFADEDLVVSFQQ